MNYYVIYDLTYCMRNEGIRNKMNIFFIKGKIMLDRSLQKVDNACFPLVLIMRLIGEEILNYRGRYQESWDRNRRILNFDDDVLLFESTTHTMHTIMHLQHVHARAHTYTFIRTYNLQLSLRM